MTSSVQSAAPVHGLVCTRLLSARTSALSDIPPLGGAAGDVTVALDRRTAFASFHHLVNDVKKGQSGDVYY
jgi:hypothetical protein